MIWLIIIIGISNQLIINLNRPAFGLYEKVIDIEKWFHQDRPTISALANYNTPLVIVGPEGSGRTTLLYQWMQFHEAKSEFFTNIVDILYKLIVRLKYLFATFCKQFKHKNFTLLNDLLISQQNESKNYLNKLQTIFDLNQRIEMQNDKLRTFFFRWIELTDKKKKQMTTDKCKIILVIDGIDRFESEESQSHQQSQHSSTSKINYQFEEESPDWFPACFPQSFRVILTCKQNSKAYKHFKNMKIPFNFLYQQDISEDSLSNIVESHFNCRSSSDSVEDIEIIKDQIMDFIRQKRQHFNNHLYLHTFLNVLYPIHIDLQRYGLQSPTIKEIKDFLTVEELFNYTLKHYETNKILPRSKFRRISCILALSKTGLKKEELKDCLEVKQDTIDIYLKLFNFALLEYKTLFRINNEQYKKTIEKLYLQEEIFKNEIHSSIVTILSKVKHFNSNARLIDEVTYNIFKQGNQWLRLKDLLSNLEIFCHLYKPQDKYTLAYYWQKLEQHGFDPVYEYNKTVEAFVLNYFPTSSELFVILTQLGRFFKELGDMETKCTPEFRHPPLVISPELEQIKLQKELELIGGMLIENKNNISPTMDEEKYNVENPLFMNNYREQQVALLKKENPLFPDLQLYYYKRWIWLQFPWFCMDINSAFSNYMNKAMGKSIHLHMNYGFENDLVIGSLKIIKEAKSRKQLSGKNQIYAVPIEFTVQEDELQNKDKKDETQFSSSDDSFVSKKDQIIKTPLNRLSNLGNNGTFTNQASPVALGTVRHNQETGVNIFGQFGDRQAITMTARNLRSQSKSRGLAQTYSQSRLPTAAFNNRFNSLSDRQSLMEGQATRKSQYNLAKAKWIDQDYELTNLKNKIKPENAIRVVANQVKNYERKELDTAVLNTREMINELNRIAFEIQQKQRIYQSLQNCILQLDTNNKESQAFEKRLTSISEKLDQTRQQYKIARKEQNRLRHIVNFCFKNKADNHEWIQGLELAVSNMVTLIKHEKESIINSKNLVLELKKGSKELAKLKDERKMLQGLTTQSMYGMITEKQNIKSLREDFEKRKNAIINGSELEQSNLKSLVLDQKFQSISSYSPLKCQSPRLYETRTSGLKSKQTMRSPNSKDLYLNTSEQDNKGLSNDQLKILIQKLEIIRQSAGAKQIEDFQQMIDFLNNYQRIRQEKDFKEQKVLELRIQKAKLQEELKAFHDMDIDAANSKYQPHQLVNTLNQDIENQQLQKNLQFNIFQKSYSKIITVRTLLEEMRKRLRLDNAMFSNNLSEINGEMLVKGLYEIQDFVLQKSVFLQSIFGKLQFHQVMMQINEIDPGELRYKILQIKKRSRQPVLSNESDAKYQTHDGVNNDINSNGIPQIILTSVVSNRSEKRHSDSRDIHSNENYLDKIERYSSHANLLDLNHMPLETHQKSITHNKKSMVKRNSKVIQQQDSLYKNSQKLQLPKQKISQEQISNLYQISRPIFLDESTYTHSVLNMSRTLKEKETLFYKRVTEFEKDQDIVGNTIKTIVDFKKKADQHSLDDSFAQIEEARKTIKSRQKLAQQENNLNQDTIDNINNPKKKFLARTSSVGFIEQRNRQKQSVQSHQKRHENNYVKDQDEEPIDDQNINHGQQKFENAHQQLGNQTQRITHEKKDIFDAFLNDEVSKLPNYARSILNSNHKDLIRRVKLLNLNVQKLDKDELIKKLIAKSDRHGPRKSASRLAQQNL